MNKPKNIFGESLSAVLRKVRLEAPEPVAQPSTMAAAPVQAPPPEPPPVRATVRYHAIPWKKKDKNGEDVRDFIPAEIRRRFDKGSKTIPLANSSVALFPTSTVIPTDRLAWGADEPELLQSLRSGFIKKMKVVGNNGMMVTKIEGKGGGSFYGFMWMESLRSPLISQVWGKFIDFSIQDGTLSRRSACSYEIAKACGLDDLTPPTVHRVDADGDVTSMIPDSLIEASMSTEWVVQRTGKSASDVRKDLGAHSSISMIRGELWPIEQEEWFSSLFGEGADPDAMNTIWATMPPERRVGMLRLAALDLVTWSLDRSWGDILFSDDERHPMVVFGGELSCVCPKTIGEMYASGGYSTFDDQASPRMPLYWSEAAMLLATRGGSKELADFEAACLLISGRMKGDRPVELTRSLLEHGLTPLQIAGVLSRLWLMSTHSVDMAKDPYFVAGYYASLTSGTPSKEMAPVAEFVDRTIKQVTVGDFNFVKEMKAKRPPDARNQ